MEVTGCSCAKDSSNYLNYIGLALGCRFAWFLRLLFTIILAGRRGNVGSDHHLHIGSTL